jgi:Na+-driven multidrug efflux pump
MLFPFSTFTFKPRKPVSIRRVVFRLSMPVLLSSLFQRLVSIVDIFLTGGLGAAAIAATGLGQLLMFVAMTVFWGLSTGTTVVIAHLWGAGKREDAGRAAFGSLSCLSADDRSLQCCRCRLGA